MKKNYFFIFALFLIYSFGLSQNIGDFQSKNIAASLWNDASSWETWNGSTWEVASSYPGQNTGIYTTTILDNTIITIPSNLSTTSIGSLIIGGTLLLGNGTSNQHITTLSTNLLVIKPTGTLTFSGPKVRLTLPASNAVLIIEPSGTINGSCTNNDEFFIDTSKYASCVGSGTNTYSFGDLIAAGGSVNAKITSPVTNPTDVSGCALINLTGGYDGVENNVTYQWIVRDPNGLTTIINSGSLVNSTITTSTSFTPNLPGEYLVSLEITTTSLATNVETRTFNIIDTTNPTITAPVNITTTTNTACTATGVALGTPTTGDNCSVASVTNNHPSTTYPLGSTTVIWTVTDAAGNSATANQTVTVTDNINPTITAPVNITTTTNTACTATGVALGTPTTADNCSVASVTNNAPAAFPLGSTTVTWTVTDGSGRIATATQTVTVTDNMNPTISCPANISQNVGAGTCTANVVTPNPTTADNCSVTKLTWTLIGATVASSAATGINNIGTRVFNLGTTTVTYTVSDAANNSVSCSFTVTITDNINPTITCPTNMTANTSASCTASVITPNPTTADNCSVTKLTWALTGTTVASSAVTGINNLGTRIFNLGITTVTYRVEDAAGNFTTCLFTVTVTDNINPTITAPANITATTNTACTATGVALGTPTTADNCSVASVTNNAPAAFPLGSTTVTWTVTDGSGRIATATQTVTVTDNMNPTISCPANISQNVGAGTCTTNVVTPNPTTADNCGVTKLTWTLTGTTIASSAATGINNLGTRLFNLGTTTVTYTVSDAANNSVSCSFTVTINDNINPTITCPTNMTANTSASCTASVVTPNPTTADNCSVTKLTWALTGATVANSATSGINNLGTRIFNLGITTVTYRVEDAAGNFTTCLFTVTVTDNINPTITAPAAINTTTNTACTATGVALGTPTTGDNCSVASVTNNAPAAFSLGSTTVTWTVTDGSGRTATATQTVTVTDNVNPTISCPANISQNVGAGTCTANVVTPNPTTADNCGVTKLTWTLTGATIASSAATGINNIGTRVFNLGITTVTYIATDAANNTATCSYTVTINDNINPTITCPTNMTANTSASCTASVVTPNPTTADNCSVTKLTWTLIGATVASSATSGINNLGTRVFNLGLTTVTYRVEDAAGNFTTCSFTVTVTDNLAPTVTLSNVTAQCSVTLTAPTASDNCAGTVTGTTNDAITYNAQGTFMVTWAFNDGNGNVTTRTQNVIIDDTIAPVANLASLPTLNMSGCQIDTLTPPTATDTCKGTINGTTTTTFPITTQGTTVVTWTYDDGNGNTTTQTQNIILTAPPISGGTLVGYISSLVPAMTPSDNIAITSCPDEVNPITMNLSNQVGTIVRWEKFEAGDSAWSVIANTTNSYNITFNFSNTKSTLFRVLIQVENCTRYSNILNVHAIPPDVPPILDQNYFNICLNTPVTLVARSGYTSTVEVGDGGDFNSGQFPDKWDPTQWKIDGEVAGAQWTAAGNNTKFNNWSGTNNHPVGTLYRIEYNSNDLKFGIAHGNFNSAAYITEFGVGPTTLETPIFSLVGLKTAAVQFDQAYNLHAGDYAKLELSLDGGSSYTVVLQNLIGTSPQAKSWAPVPYPYQAPKSNNSTTTYFNFQNDNSSFDISEYIGNDNVRIKWTFFGTTDESAWAIDNITIPVKPYSDAIEWTDGLGTPGEYIIRDQLAAAYTFTPSAPGVHLYGATSLINGCRAYDPDGTAIATVRVNYAYAGEAMGYTNEECGERTVQLNAYDNTKSADLNKANGAYPLALNTYSDDPGTGETGKWSVFSTTNTCGTYNFSNISSPTSSFSGDAGVYTLRWKLDVSGCYSDVQVTLTNCNVVDFDGVDDYVTFKNNYGLGTDFSIEIWVKPDPQPANPLSNIQTILSKRNANNPIDGYDLRLTGSILSFNWNNESQIVSPFPLTTSRWYHVAITRNSGIYKLYVDGIEVANAAGSAPISNNFDCILGAMNQTGNPSNKPVNHFSGWLDELRIWNTGLNSEHIRQMMNQQIVNNGTAVRGEIVPLDINGPDANKDGVDDQQLFWVDLIGYYRMNQIDCGYLKPYGGKGVDGKLRNTTSSQEETAPLPYVSIRDGNWIDKGTGTTPWKYGDSVWDYPNSTGYKGTPIDWNIVQTTHNINSGNKDITVLGLISTAGKLTVADPVVTSPIENNDGQGLWITHYLKLNGIIDLVGESQLVQKRYITNQFSESILDVTSSGYLERDQQGKRNSFNYNYWSSPVSNIQGIINNTTYSPASVLKDGTNSSIPKNITFGDGAYFADGALTNPILTSNRWIWSYNSKTLETNTEWQDYFQWNYVGNTGLLKTGEGFTMKGTGGIAAIDVTQNYVFVGKPNNGNIALTLPYDQTYLVGNPYPSALDADEFILDNLAGRAGVNVFNGALYFWDHFGLSNNHYLAEYQGGYATYTLIGGVKAIATSSLTAGGAGSKVPQRYIPVGQGFFVDAYLDPTLSGTAATVSGGTLNFKNSQRVFMRESAPNSVFMKKRGPKTAIVTKPKIRLAFESSVGAHRQLLIGVDSNTTNSFDVGYDAPMFDTNENDMYWKINDSQFVIQGVPDFNTNRIIPLGLVVANEGEVTIKIDELENVPSSTQIYLHDAETAMYHNLKNTDYKTTLPAGNYDNRFSLTFENLTTEIALDVTENGSNDGIIVLYSSNYKILIIKNNIPDTTVNSVSLYNMLGQFLSNWDVKDKEQTNIQIPIKNLPSGIYIVKVKTSKGESSKKIIVN